MADNPSQYGFLWGIDNETPARAMGTTLNNVVVGSHSIKENSVAGYEFIGWYYTSSETKSCTNPESTSFPSVNVQKNITRRITLCNKKTPLVTLQLTYMMDCPVDTTNTWRVRNPNQTPVTYTWSTPQGNSGGPLVAQPGDNFFETPRGTETMRIYVDGVLQSTKASGNDLSSTDVKCLPKTGNLKVVKDVVNDDGGNKTYQDFTFKIGDTTHNFDATNSPDGQKVLTLPVGAYTVTENEADTMGYSTTYDNCTNIVVVQDQTVTCTITNNDNPGKLIVKKVVINDNGGTKQAKDFSFTVNGGKVTSFEADGENELSVEAGKHEVVEVAEAGYTTTYENCDVMIALSETKTCTITNNDKPAKVTITKNTVGDSDEMKFQFSSTNGNFGLSSGGSYIANNLSAGTTFEATEQEADGWVLAYVSCGEGADWTWIEGGVKVDLAAGDDVNCEFWNVKLGSISGFKLNDTNGNGLMEVSEEKLPGWTIQLWAECEMEEEIELSYLSDLRSEPDYEDCTPQLLDETVTDENGEYSFTNLPDGTYYVCEVMQAGWERTFPADNDCHTVIVEDGEDCIANFANREKKPGNVLGSSTTSTTTPTKVLANTGTPFAQGLIVGLSILGMASGITALSRRKHYLVK